MQKELDKIERFASEVTERSKMNKESADNLLAGVKVNRIHNTIIHTNVVSNYYNSMTNCRNLYQGIESNFTNWIGEARKWMKRTEIYW